jgi:hypothetical protein
MLAGPEHVPGQPAIPGRPSAGGAPETELERRTRELQVRLGVDGKRTTC